MPPRRARGQPLHPIYALSRQTYEKILLAEQQTVLERERLAAAEYARADEYAIERQRLEQCQQVCQPPAGPPVVRFWWERPPPCERPPAPVPPRVTPPPPCKDPVTIQPYPFSQKR